jgi:hypothetical protein
MCNSVTNKNGMTCVLVTEWSMTKSGYAAIERKTTVLLLLSSRVLK